MGQRRSSNVIFPLIYENHQKRLKFSSLMSDVIHAIMIFGLDLVAGIWCFHQSKNCILAHTFPFTRLAAKNRSNSRVYFQIKVVSLKKLLKSIFYHFFTICQKERCNPM